MGLQGSAAGLWVTVPSRATRANSATMAMMTVWRGFHPRLGSLSARRSLRVGGYAGIGVLMAGTPVGCAMGKGRMLQAVY